MSNLPPFQTLLDEHAADVLGFLAASVGRHDADDCFQETFISALRAYPDLQDARNLRAWLLTIASRKAIDHHRSKARRPRPVEELPERGVRDREPDFEVWRAVAGLPAKQREAVALRFAGDLPHREIAAAIGGTEEAARRNVHEGLKKLREVLA